MQQGFILPSSYSLSLKIRYKYNKNPVTQTRKCDKRSGPHQTAAPVLTALLILLCEKKMLTVFFGYHEN